MLLVFKKLGKAPSLVAAVAVLCWLLAEAAAEAWEAGGGEAASNSEVFLLKRLPGNALGQGNASGAAIILDLLNRLCLQMIQYIHNLTISPL
jgi:hypothetical protein